MQVKSVFDFTHYRALTGVFSDPVDDNPTGVMEEADYEALDLNRRYITTKASHSGRLPQRDHRSDDSLRRCL